MATTHQLVNVEAFSATQPGALDGHQATCACGHVERTSLSAGAAASLMDSHLLWAAKQARKAAR